MDYCSSCRRHLNGALMCPGCGAYAPDIAPVIPPSSADGYPVPGLAARPATDTAVWDAVEEEPYSEPSDGPQDAPSAPQGRAARRRQVARWKKNQRRAVVATAVALVGGGLTVSAMDRQSAPKAQASTAPDVPSTPGVEEPTSQHIRPAVTRPGTQRSTPTTDLPRTRSAPARGTPPGAEPDASSHTASPQRASNSYTADTTRTTHTTQTNQTGQTGQTAATPAPAQGDGSSSLSGTTATGNSDTAPQPASTPAAAANAPQNTPRTSPANATPSSPQLCLLVVCLG